MEMEKRPSLVDRLRVSLYVSPRGIVQFLVAVVAILLALDIFLQIYHYRVHEVPWLLKDVFDVDEEQNIPTWYSQAALLFSAWLLYSIAGGKRQTGDRDHRYWLGLAIGFTVLSLDEGAVLHEVLNTVLNDPNTGIGISWAVPAAILVLILAIVYARFVFRLPGWFRWRCLVAGVVYAGGILGMELVAHEYCKTHDIDSLGYQMLAAVEEGMEMYSVVFFISTLLTYMSGGTRFGLADAVAPVGSAPALAPAGGSEPPPAGAAPAATPEQTPGA